MIYRMLKKFLIFVPVLLLATTALAADGHRGEISFNLGWTLSDGVTGDPVLGGDGNFYNQISPKDSFSWGFTGEFFIGDNAEVGFRFNRQQSKLEIGGTVTREIGDLNVDNYHGIFSYNFGESDSSMRPFIFGGLGATDYGTVDFTFAGAPRSISGPTRFSTVWGGGVKFYAARNFGIRLEASWTPTHIKTDTVGWWCDPFWGCYLVGNAQYSNQLELGGGINLRF